MSKLSRCPALAVILNQLLTSAVVVPATTHGTGTTCGVALLRLVVTSTTVGNSSMQNSRKLETPDLLASRHANRPSGASAGTSRCSVNLPGSVPFLSVVGMATLAGKLVQNP